MRNNVSRSRYRKNYKVRAASKPAKVSIVAKVRRTREQAYGTFVSWRTIAEAVKRRDGYRCTKCNASERRELDVHHIIPVSQGGKTAMVNLTTLCDTCHSKQPRHRHMR